MRIGEIGQLVRGAASDFVEDKAPQLSAALAYYAIFSIAPLLVIAITVAGFFIGESYARGEIVEEVQRYLGETGAGVIESMITGMRERGDGTIASIISIFVLLFGATGAFGQLQDALNTVWEVEPRRGGGIWRMLRDRGLAFLLVLGIGALLLCSAVVSTILASMTAYAASHIPGGTLWVYLADFAGTAIIAFLLFALIFKVLPDAEIAWSDVWIGSAITAILFAFGKIGLGFYLGRGTVASSYGLAGSAIVILLWTYYSAMIVLFGAELTQAYANQYGTRLGAARSGAGHKRRKGAPQTAAGFVAPSVSERSNAMPLITDEREYLQNEAELARTAIRSTLEELTLKSKQAANPALWTRQYPWLAVGIAAAAGAVVGNRLLHVPGRGADGKEDSRERRRAERLRQHALEAELEHLRKEGSRTVNRFLSTLKRAILRLVKASIRSTLVAALSAGTAASAVRKEEPTQTPAGVE